MSVSTPIDTTNKRPSRANSISSSVVTTIKKSASVSSRTDPRTSYLQSRSTSPDSISRVLHTLNSSRSEVKGRTDILEARKAAAGLGVHRWSHSTSSSLSTIDADLITRRTSSLRKSSGHTPNTFSSTSGTRNSRDHQHDRTSSKRSSSTSNGASSRAGSRLAFRDSSNLNIVQGLSQQAKPVGAARGPNSTWEQTSGVNKFGDTVQSLSIHYTTPNTNNNSPIGLLDSKVDQIDRASDRVRPVHGQRSESSTVKHRDNNNTGRNPTGNASMQDTPPRREANHNDTRSPRRRDMLSRALAKANEAVLLDNAQNVNAAIESYNEACELLQLVMVRSADLADRRKLSSIKATYSRRIAELHDFDNTFEDLMRPLPDDPPTDEYENPEDFYQEDAMYQHTAINDTPAIQLPLRQESLLPEIFGGDNYIHDNALPPVPQPIPNSALNIPMDEQYMPAPLSPRPPLQTDDQNITPTQSLSIQDSSQVEQDVRDTDPTTWLEQPSDQSSKSSSRLSSVDFGKKGGQLMSAIEAEFDAMNAAVDSAYDELDQEVTPRNADKKTDSTEENRYNHLSGTYLDDDAEEEERLLESVLQDNDASETQPEQQTASALPRQSDSSGFSARTWGSSVASTTATTRTTLSTLAETIEPPLHAPPTAMLPEPPQSPPKVSEAQRGPLVQGALGSEKTIGIRDRRMSGQSAKQLKIETFVRRSSIAQQMRPPQTAPAVSLAEALSDVLKGTPQRTLAPAASFSSFPGATPLTPLLSIHSSETPLDETPSTPALTQGGSTDDGTFIEQSPSRHGRMMPPPPGPISRRNNSSSNLGKGSLSINTGHLEAESPMTPGSAMFGPSTGKPQSAVSSAVSNPGTTVLSSVSLGGMYLLDTLIGDPRSPRSPSSIAMEPVPLEPCPDSFLLRPFWLMRCLYQALAHPQGGYVSTKLFIPRDIWRVRNVKIKALDDKIAQCDLLTAALQKLSNVDTLDASAVLEELQSFEIILDQVRTTLSKKLGTEVGVSGSSNVFKASPAVEESSDTVHAKTVNTSSAAKSFASGWRKLRSKSSSTNLNTVVRSEQPAQILTMTSLPMTSSSSVPTSRSYSNARKYHPPPTPSALPQMLAPHANYVSSMARLFDAVQVLDNIARQAEDPGLKYSSQTHVGLELSIRNAAEFFAFYVIRFVMSDLLMLLDKFLKRGSEWVIS